MLFMIGWTFGEDEEETCVRLIDIESKQIYDINYDELYNKLINKDIEVDNIQVLEHKNSIKSETDRIHKYPKGNISYTSDNKFMGLALTDDNHLLCCDYFGNLVATKDGIKIAPDVREEGGKIVPIFGTFKTVKYINSTNDRIERYKIKSKMFNSKCHLITEDYGINILRLIQSGNDIIPNFVDEIASNAGVRCMLGDVVLPSSIKSIGAFAFQKSIIDKMDLSNTTITEIRESTFNRCIINKLVLSKSIEIIRNKAFRKCRMEEKLELNEGLMEIEDSAFELSRLKGIKMPNSLKKIGNEVFFGCRCGSIELNEGLKSIGNNAFSHSNIKELKIPGSVTNLGTNIASGCKEIERVVIGKGIKNLNLELFSGCNRLKDIAISDSLESIGNYKVKELSREEVIKLLVMGD